jgi:hypothetical protein
MIINHHPLLVMLEKWMQGLVSDNIFMGGSLILIWSVGVCSSFPDSASTFIHQCKKYMLIEGDVSVSKNKRARKKWQPF